jgi:hypothetical protein
MSQSLELSKSLPAELKSEYINRCVEFSDNVKLMESAYDDGYESGYQDGIKEAMNQMLQIQMLAMATPAGRA